MRPCNQCGTPVGNGNVVCVSCRSENHAAGRNDPAAMRPFGPDNPAKPAVPSKLSLLEQRRGDFILFLFWGVFGALFALVALAMGCSWGACAIAGIVGYVLSHGLLRFMI